MAEQVDADHAVVLRQDRRQRVPPVQRAGVTVDQHDRRALGSGGPPRGPARRRRAGVRISAALDRDLGALGLVVEDDRVDDQQDREPDRIAMSDLHSRGSTLSSRGAEPELVGARLHRRDHEGDVLVEVDAELLGALADLVTVDARSERGLLELLLDGLRRHPLDAGRADERAGGDEAGELIDREERLGHVGLARDAQEGGVPGDRVDELLGPAALLEQPQGGAGVAVLGVVEIREALVVEVVDQARHGPQLLVAAALARVGDHRRLDAQ